MIEQSFNLKFSINHFPFKIFNKHYYEIETSEERRIFQIA